MIPIHTKPAKKILVPDTDSDLDPDTTHDIYVYLEIIKKHNL